MLNNTKKNQGQAMQILFSIILLLSLMISGLLTIVFGADVYEKINERATENFNSSTALSYVSSKVRQQDTSGAISVEEHGDISVLKITEKYDDVAYYTKIYVKDGKFIRGCKIRITRDSEQIYEGALASLKRFKDDVKEVNTGYECGLVFEKFNDIKEGDYVEAYDMVEVSRG